MLDLLDLLVDKPEMCHSTLQLRQCVGRNGATLRRPQPRKPFRCFAQFRVEAANTEANQRRFHAVDDAGAFPNQLLALAGRALGILLLICSLINRRCAIPRCSSASVLDGMALPSGVRNPGSRSGALRSFGLKPRIPRRTSAAFMRLMMLVRFPTSCSRSRVGRLASSS